MANGTSSLPSFEKLQDESNYAIWKFQMELYLVHEDLWKYTKITPSTDELEIQKDQVARAKIGLMVEQNCIIYVRHTNNTREAWEALRDAFEDAGINSKSRLLRKLVSLKSDQFDTMRQYVTAIMLSAQELKDIGKEVDDELLATILLQGLTEEYTPIRLMIQNSNTALTADYVKTRLLEIENQHKTAVAGDFGWVDMPIQYHGRAGRDKQMKCRICTGNHAMRGCPELSFTVPSRERERIYRSNRGYDSTLPSGSGRSTNWLIDSGDYAQMNDRRDYPCFLVFARMMVCCLVKIFKLW